MPNTERVTVSLPKEIVRDIDHLERNRSRFILEAVRRELERRRREELRRSIRRPHSDADRVAETGFDAWARSLPDEDPQDLLELDSGTPVRWVSGEGWQEADE